MTTDLSPVIILNAKKQLELLRALHIQSQTETLNIESQEWEQLTRTVAVKEKLVSNIILLEKEIRSQLELSPLELDSLSEEKKELLRGIDHERILLREKITRIETRNVSLLEEVKAEAIRASQQIRQYEKVLQGYLSSQTQVPKISQIVE